VTYVFHRVTLGSDFIASSDSVSSELECRTTPSWFDLRYMSTVVLRTDPRHEKCSQDSLDTGYDMKFALPGHEDYPPDRFLANPCLVAHERGPSNGRTVAFVTEEFLPVTLPMSIIQWQFLIASCSAALVKPTAKLCSKFPVLYVRI
jgi:hypothetical protein